MEAVPSNTFAAAASPPPRPRSALERLTSPTHDLCVMSTVILQAIRRSSHSNSAAAGPTAQFQPLDTIYPVKMRLASYSVTEKDTGARVDDWVAYFTFAIGSTS
ncbi:hypothetical protein SERLADRAFT_438443 [Serpula lacrymans var. lacrymans S7.9]|uniref:Uncharacterized protein n=1 Tax=Serpula lacrymans var. lacrymans (strain S7.9) TaxID=578457 RepID=F8NY82_SERL9|nr:uncharacterized protein SERLADRAFT_438443 [Serpula lacrymans var. lacrymans S7.9]EGO24844.1 hypothetical protein SERLADRAFT_438443 [Serpula lacrymans var. lacrymans S7.9]